MRLSVVLGAVLLAAVGCLAGTVEDYARNIAPLIEPAKLATLGPRGANQRVQKVTYWMAMAKKDKKSTSSVAWQAVLLAGYTNNEQGCAGVNQSGDGAQPLHCAETRFP